MDFNRFDTVARAEGGFEYHIKCPATGQPMFDNDEDAYADNGKPCIAILKGREAASVRAALHAANQARAKFEKGNSAAAMNVDEIHEIMVSNGIAVIDGFRNVNRDDRPAKARDADWFLNLNRFIGPSDEKSFVEQIVDASSDRGNVLGNGSSA